MKLLLLLGVCVCTFAKPSWSVTPAGNFEDQDGCFDLISKHACIAKNVPTSQHKRFTSASVRCLWCHSATNNTALYHPDHCAPLSAVKSTAYANDQMVCSYRHPNNRHKPGQFFAEEEEKAPTKKPSHKNDKHKNGGHGEHKNNKPRHHNNGEHKPHNKAQPQRQMQRHQPHSSWNKGAAKWGRHAGKARPFPKAGTFGRKLLEALNIEDPYSGGGGASPTENSPISSLPPALQFLAGLALGLLDETPSSIVMCGANVADVIEDIEDAFNDFHLSVSGIVQTLTDLFNAIRDFTEVLRDCGLEAVLDKITSFLAKYATPVVGEILGAITITFNAINVYDDIDDAVHSSESGDWFDVGKDIGDVIGIVA